MSYNVTKSTISNYYNYFNNSQLEALFGLIADDVVHHFNQDGVFVGKEAFIKFILDTKHHYDEQINDYTIMISEDGEHATTKFTVKGKYLHTDASSIPAIVQTYELQVFNYFRIVDGLIKEAHCMYNEDELVAQLHNEASNS